MSNLIGAVSLSNNQGVFIGSVNLNNLNLDPNQIVYSSDGINMSGLNIGDGLQKVSDELVTVGNPDIQITSNIIYINEGVSDIQTGINNATQGDVINVSSGSYGGATVTISDKQNIAIICPNRGQGSTICELAGGRGLTIANTSSTITINSLQIEGLTTLGATANNYFTNLQCLGGITISAGATGNYFFYMSEIAGAITVPNTFAGVLFFSECNFSGASFSLNNISPLQVQITQSLNLPTSRPVKATFSANNADTSQQITTNTKFLNDSQTNLGKYLSSDGANGVVWSTLPSGVLKQFYYLSARTPTQSAITIDIGTPVSLSFDITKYYKVTVIYNFNVLGGGGGGISQCIFALRDDNEYTLQQMEFNLSKPHQTITIIFYVQPLLASSKLYFLISSPDQIENSTTDTIIWDIQEIQ